MWKLSSYEHINEYLPVLLQTFRSTSFKEPLSNLQYKHLNSKSIIIISLQGDWLYFHVNKYEQIIKN